MVDLSEKLNIIFAVDVVKDGFLKTKDCFSQWRQFFKTQHILIVGRIASKVNGVPTCIDNEVVKNYGWCAQNPCDENGW